MLENDGIEQLFKSELTKTRSFGNRQSQWELVSARLNRRRRSMLFWFLPILMLSLGGIFILSKNNQLPNENITLSEKIIVDNKSQVENTDVSTPNIEMVASTSSNHPNAGQESKILNEQSNSPLSISSIEKAENQLKPNQKVLPSNYTNQILKNEAPAIITSSSEENITKTNQNSISNTKIYNPDGVYNSELKENPNSHTSQTLNNQQLKPKELPNKLLSIPVTESLPLKPVYFEREIESIHFNAIKPMTKNHIVYSINTGLFMESVNQDSLIDHRNIGWAVGMGISTSKVSLRFGYKKNKIERGITSNLDQYNIPDTTFVYGYELPDLINLNYTYHLLDINIGYKLISKGQLDWELFTGLQARRISSGHIKYDFGGTYNPIELENDISSQKFQLSDVRFGSAIQYALHKRFGLTLQYNLAIPLEVSSIKWPKRHQFELGINYHLN